MSSKISRAASAGGAISAADYALGFVDLIEKGDHHRAQVNLGH
jgi:putative NADH-flavin reductase